MKECLTAQQNAFEANKGKITKEKLDDLKFHCVSNYKTNMKDLVPIIKSYYDGYLKNYGPDGSLIKKQFDIK